MIGMPPVAAPVLLDVELAAVWLARTLEGYDGQPVPAGRVRQWAGRIRVWAHRYPGEVHKHVVDGRVLFDPEELLRVAAARRPRVVAHDHARL